MAQRANAREISLIGRHSSTGISLEGEISVCNGAAEEPKASARAITLNFITGGLGSALFSLPWSVAGSSVVPSIVIVAGVLLLNGWTISIVVRAGERHQVFDLGGIIGRLPGPLGPPLQAVTNLFVWASMFFCLISYILVIHDSASKFVKGTFLESRIVLTSIASLCILPLCFLSQRLLERTSILAVAVNIYLFILIGVLYGRKASSDTLPEGCCILGTTVRGTFSMVTVMFQAVIIQMCVLPMYKDLQDRSPRKFDKIVAVGFGVLFFIFSGFSCVGYLLVGPKVRDNLLADLDAGVWSSIAQVGTILVVSCVFPIMLAPMVAPVEDGEGRFLGVDRRFTVVVAKCVIVAACALAAARIPSLGVVNVVNGAMSAMIFVVLVPSVVGLTLLDTSRCQKVVFVILLVGGLAMTSMGFVFNDNYVGDLKCLIAAGQ
mmetsp:Transcript_103372/g.287825  ORF Transcript_103372/g.287825 Transcript_103372/m.287825 type:complete len:434 (+) Transcript_103372:160-1461(+)